MFVITNMTDDTIVIDGVDIESKRQLSIQHVTDDMLRAQKTGSLRILSSDETLEERRADIKAMGSLDLK